MKKLIIITLFLLPLFSGTGQACNDKPSPTATETPLLSTAL